MAPRKYRLDLITLAICGSFLCFIEPVTADCWYEGLSYPENSKVVTAEPCLRCQCQKGVLLCYLRVCPHLPDPPPPGCFLLHKHRTCCPELICTDLPVGGNRIEARFEPDVPEIPYNQTMVGQDGCIFNGTVYASGSAMSTSSLCEYCYCIEGIQKCVKPRCLLPLEGCTAQYAPHSCCPTSYTCPKPTFSPLEITTGAETTTEVYTTTEIGTTTIRFEDFEGGCRVGNQKFQEGSKVISKEHTPCDNCYCMKGSINCMPLQCAPPLLGCTPVVPQGECCAASYNCSGVLEVKTNLKYDNFPVVSKEYSKLRKEQQLKRKFSSSTKADHDRHQMAESNIPHYVIAETPNSKKEKSTPYYFSTTLPSVQDPTTHHGTTRQLPITYIFNPVENKYSKISLTTTKVNGNYEHMEEKRPVFDPSKMEHTTLQNFGFDSRRRPISSGLGDQKVPGTPIVNSGDQKTLISTTARSAVDPKTSPTKEPGLKNPIFPFGTRENLRTEQKEPIFTTSNIRKTSQNSPGGAITQTELPTPVVPHMEDFHSRPIYDPSILEGLIENRYRLNRPIYNPNRFTTSTQPPKVIKIKNNRPIFQPTRENTKIRRPSYPQKEEPLPTRLPNGPKIIKIKNNRPIYEGDLEARSEDGPKPELFADKVPQIPNSPPTPMVETRIPYDRYQNNGLNRPVFDPSSLELMSQSRNSDSTKLSRPIYDPSALMIDLENRNNFRNQKTSFRPDSYTTEGYKPKIRLPNLDPNSFTTLDPQRRPVYERIKLKYPSTTEGSTRRFSFRPVLSTIYPEIEEPTSKKTSFELFGMKLEGLINSLTTTRRKFEESTRRPVYLNDIDVNELNFDGRNNRRIAETLEVVNSTQSTEASKVTTIETTTGTPLEIDSTTENFEGTTMENTADDPEGTQLPLGTELPMESNVPDKSMVPETSDLPKEPKIPEKVDLPTSSELPVSPGEPLKEEPTKTSTPISLESSTKPSTALPAKVILQKSEIPKPALPQKEELAIQGSPTKVVPSGTTELPPKADLASKEKVPETSEQPVSTSSKSPSDPKLDLPIISNKSESTLDQVKMRENKTKVALEESLPGEDQLPVVPKVPDPTGLELPLNVTHLNITTEITNNVECIDSTEVPIISNDILEERIDLDIPETTTTSVDFSTTDVTTFKTTLTEDDPKNLSTTISSLKKIDQIEAILNITSLKKEEDFDYDYSEPTLPPSLPNLRIIPFVAADAVVEEKIPGTEHYPSLVQERISHGGDGSSFQYFSPPKETEGGFVPREPPNFYEKYHTTKIVDITSGTGVPAITVPPKTAGDNCVLEGRIVRHGELTSENGACSVCLCLFGDVVCNPPKCPQIPPGCRRVPSPKAPCCGRIVCNGDDESPTVVLARLDVPPNIPEPVTVAELVVTPDPFRDVIKTEPAPNLQSLMGDMVPFLARQTSTTQKPTVTMTEPTTPRTTTTVEPSTTEPVEEGGGFFDMFQFLFGDDKNDTGSTTAESGPTTTEKTTTTSTTTTPKTSTTSSATTVRSRTSVETSTHAPVTTSKASNNKVFAEKPPENSISKNSIDPIGILKLAGCNIYGRMYRVGRIISELSSPCRECRCTEIGVQCKNLGC